METLVQDLRYGIRALLKNKSFTAVAVLTLALGIGANSAIFSVVHAVLLRPLPYQDPGKLVMIWHSYPDLNLPKAAICAPCYREYRDQTNAFENVATSTSWNVNLTGTGEPERLQGARVSWNWFDTFGVTPIRGRGFVAEEDQPGSTRVVVLSHGFWQRRFGGDAGILNQPITLDGNSYTVIGIMPKGFTFLMEIDAFTPIAFTSEQLAADNHGFEYLISVARLKQGVTLQQAQAEMNTLADQLRPQFYGPDARWGLSLVPISEELIGNFRLQLLILFGAVGCVLLIACANVANLLMARASARQKEFSIRTALGASRLRIVRQLLTESVLLAVFGGVIGLAIAYGGIKLLLLGVPERATSTITGWQQVSLNFWVLGFTLLVSLVTGLIFGLIPAFHAAKTDLNETLKEGSRGSTGGRHRIRSALVVAEVAISMVLLIGAGLLVRSFVRLLDVNPGFNPANVATMQLSLPRSKYKDTEQVAAFYNQTLEQIRSLPGVQAAGVTDNVPMGNNNSTATFSVEGLQVAQGEPSPHGDNHSVSADYFAALGVPLRAGRYFTEQDGKDAQPVAIIDESLAAQYYPDGNAIGKRIAANFESRANERKWRTIVGVVGTVKQYGLEGKRKKVQYYLPVAQNPQRNMFLVVRNGVGNSTIVPAVRAAIQHVDKDQPIYRVMAMEQVVADSVGERRLVMYLLAIFAGVALLLATVGIYGVMSYSVTQRTHEIGIRMALGAQTADVMKMVVRQGMTITLVGVGIGIIGTFVLTQVIASLIADLLFGVGANDPITFAAISAILVGVALGACLVPARRATKVDPMIALRYE